MPGKLPAPTSLRQFVFHIFLLLALAVAALPESAHARQAGSQPDERRRAFELFDKAQYQEALPLLERLSAANPSDGAIAVRLGFSIFANSKTIKDAEARRKERVRARAALVRAKELGVRDELMEALLGALPPDGGERESESFSTNKEADESMRAGEAAFVRGETEQAVAAYERALKFDPKLYEAPLFAGDAYFKNKQWDKAVEWYARAVRINPERETAYRYWGNALMLAGQTDGARDKYVEAIIADPYNGYVWENGLARWANRSGVRLAHPLIEQPKSSSAPEARQDGESTAAISLERDAPGEKDAAHYWLSYELVRAAWRTANFAKEFPEEKTYRHSLKEESAALAIVADAVSRDIKEGKIKTPEQSFVNLVRLRDEGLLEAYVLFARADKGIARDYEAYRKNNRGKLRRYLVEYVASGKT